MNRKDLLHTYSKDSQIATIAEALKKDKEHIQLKGLRGSLDSIVAASIYKLRPVNHLFICQDREEAAYFQNDLQNILDKDILSFPSSYKKAYQFEEIENANVLQRAEVLNRLNQKESKGELIVTFPDALTEKVINKRSLVKNTFGVQVGEKIDTNFVSELLTEYGFEKNDFVYEAGQFAIRGGIIDIFSYANDLPFRIELFGKEVESIRTFNPDSQLSVETKKSISIIPDVKTKLLQEQRVSFLEYITPSTIIWAKDLDYTKEIIAKYYESVVSDFDKIKRSTGDTVIVNKPEELFIQPTEFNTSLKKFGLVEFGTRFTSSTSHSFEFHSKLQPSFNKNFELLADNLSEYLLSDYKIIISAESARQIERLKTIFEEIEPDLEIEDLNIGIRLGFIDNDQKLLIYTDHQIFERYYKYKAKERYSKTKALTLRELKTLQPGDFVTHIDYGIGRFAGMHKVENNGTEQEAIRIIYKDDDILYVSVHALHKIAKYSGKDSSPPSMSKLGSPEWENKKKKVKKKVKEIAINLISLYAKRKAAKGIPYSQDSFLQAELESSFIYEDTPDQAKATEDVKNDMEQAFPMDRLVCGDVGFGKTEVAIRAAFKAVCDNKQVAVLVPTTILAMQHYKTFKERLQGLPCKVDYINRFKTTAQIKSVLESVKAGETHILIGTHRLISKDISYKDLGLLIIDEEQKFGVAAKEKIKEFKVNVDVLTLTATPIPRTLQFSLMGARDLSVIATPPPNRQPVTTEVVVFNEKRIRDTIGFELKRGGQVFFVHNRVNDIEEIANIIMRLHPDASVGVAHGQMEGQRLEKVMMRFIEGYYDILVSTNIIESGLDIPNANTIIINQAQNFGLSDLHQMRGRVGRSNKKAFCYLLTPPISGLTTDARKRLKTLEEFSDLGDGFKIAMRDLDIRGAGNLLGGDQSGFINDIGFETYHKLLDESIQELKETEFKELFENQVDVQALKRDCVIETDLSVVIPEDYVTNISERLRLYNELDNIKKTEDLEKFQTELSDRFGPLPDEVNELIKSVELRWQGENLGFEKLKIKNNTMKGQVTVANNDAYFQSEVFGIVLKYIQEHPKTCSFKESRGQMIITFKEVRSINQGIAILHSVQKPLKETITQNANTR